MRLRLVWRLLLLRPKVGGWWRRCVLLRHVRLLLPAVGEGRRVMLRPLHMHEGGQSNIDDRHATGPAHGRGRL